MRIFVILMVFVVGFITEASSRSYSGISHSSHHHKY